MAKKKTAPKPSPFESAEVAPNERTPPETRPAPNNPMPEKKVQIDPEIMKLRAKYRAEVKAYQLTKDSARHLENIVKREIPRLTREDREKLAIIVERLCGPLLDTRPENKHPEQEIAEAQQGATLTEPVAPWPTHGMMMGED
jgi:hypothetical protein